MTLIQDVRITDVMFSHEDLDGTQTSWNISWIDRQIIPLLKAGKIEVQDIPIEPWFTELCLNNRGLEKHRFERITEEALKIPTYWVGMEDGTYLLIDGTHRYAYAGTHGKETILGVIVPEEIERAARLSIPKIKDFMAYKNRFSGIL